MVHHILKGLLTLNVVVCSFASVIDIRAHGAGESVCARPFRVHKLLIGIGLSPLRLQSSCREKDCC